MLEETQIFFFLGLIIYKNQYFIPLALIYTKTSILFPWPYYIQKPVFFSLDLLIYKNQNFPPWPYYIQTPVFYSLGLMIYKNQYLFPWLYYIQKPGQGNKILVFVYNKAKGKNTGFCI
jgi:hypothetical protein